MPVKPSTKFEELQEQLKEKLKQIVQKVKEEYEKRKSAEEAGGGGGGKIGGPESGSLGEPGQGDDGNDFSGLPVMLERIRKTLGNLVKVAPLVVPVELVTELQQTWPIAEKRLRDAIATVSNKNVSSRVISALKEAGLTGAMLKMKQVSVEYHMNRIDQAILTYPKESWKEKLFGVVKPGFKIMNSILGSFFKAIPGVEAVKEFKDHLEAGYEAGENLTEGREL